MPSALIGAEGVLYFEAKTVRTGPLQAAEHRAPNAQKSAVCDETVYRFLLSLFRNP